MFRRVRKKSFSAGCSKMSRCKAPEILRNDAYLVVRCNDEGLGQRRRRAFFSSLDRNAAHIVCQDGLGTAGISILSSNIKRRR